MFNILKRKSKGSDDDNSKNESGNLFSRLKQGLSKTRSRFTDGLASIVIGKKIIDQTLFDDLEAQLIQADVGIETTTQVLTTLTEKLNRKALKDPESLIDALREELLAILRPVQKPLDASDKKPFVILVVGVNGSGKTTSIAKLAKYFSEQGKKVLLAAGDTFRAAAIEQLQIWGERQDVLVVSQKPGSDSAAVIFDAVQSAKAKNIDIVLADTAGRLHTQSHLMDELKKVKRVIQKIDDSAPHETLLVLDAGIGQNALQQANQFNEAVGVSGIVTTKLDGTAKGGILFAIAKQLGIPIRFIGVGEQADDLQPFVAEAFIDALFESGKDAEVSTSD